MKPRIAPLLPTPTPTPTLSRQTPAEPGLADVELRVLADGTIHARNLTPAVAGLLLELNPADDTMRRRAAAGRGNPAVTARRGTLEMPPS